MTYADAGGSTHACHGTLLAPRQHRGSRAPGWRGSIVDGRPGGCTHGKVVRGLRLRLGSSHPSPIRTRGALLCNIRRGNEYLVRRVAPEHVQQGDVTPSVLRHEILGILSHYESEHLDVVTQGAREYVEGRCRGNPAASQFCSACRGTLSFLRRATRD
jgi:hypothetical protein